MRLMRISSRIGGGVHERVFNSWFRKMTSSSSLPYTKPGRLADVMALIQVLSRDVRAHRSEDGLSGGLQGNPQSASTWTDVASQHPEFFRLRSEGTNRLSLISRHVLPPDAGGVRPSLEPDLMGRLLATAIELHDRQVARAQRWQAYVPIVVPILVAIIAGVIAGSVCSSAKAQDAASCASVWPIHHGPDAPSPDEVMRRAAPRKQPQRPR